MHNVEPESVKEGKPMNVAADDRILEITRMLDAAPARVSLGLLYA